MRPRTWLEGFLLIASVGGLAFGLLWKLATDTPAEESTLLGLGFGVIAGAIGAGNLAEYVVTVDVPDRASFLVSLTTCLAEQDLYPVTELENFRVYESKPEGTVSLGPVTLRGIVRRVRVKLEGTTATIVAPKGVLTHLGLAS